MDPINLPSLPMSLSDSFESDNAPLICRRNCKAPVVVSSFFAHNHNDLIIVRLEGDTFAKVGIEEAKSNLRYDIIDLD